jgi:hypothetical protein
LSLPSGLESTTTGVSLGVPARAGVATAVADLAAAVADLAAGFEAEARGVRDTERWSSVSVPIHTGCVLKISVTDPDPGPDAF